jgi:hypothetical protein
MAVLVFTVLFFVASTALIAGEGSSEPGAAVTPQIPANTAAQPRFNPWYLSAHPFGLLSMAELIKLPPADKRMFWKLSTGYQYDTNAILNAIGAPVPTNVAKKNDGRKMVNIIGSYIPYRSQDHDYTLNYAFFNSNHDELDDFNLTQNMVELAGRWNLTKRRTLRYSTVYQHLLLGKKIFDEALMTGPSLVYSSGHGHTTSIDLRYRKTDYRNVSIFATNSNRTGHNWSGAVTHSIQVTPKRLVRVGYSYDVDHARTATWDGAGHKVSYETSYILPNDMLFNCYNEYYRKDYDGLYMSIGGKRHDSSYTSITTLTKYFNEKYGVSLRTLWSRNWSNVAAFDMSRAIHGILIDTRF